MFGNLKHGAIYALIMAFLAQPVWAGTIVGESVDGAAAWTNALTITATENTPAEDAVTYGVQVQDTFTGGLLTNELAGDISASSTSADGSALAYGMYLGVLTADLVNAGGITAEATVSVDGFFGATAYGVFANMATGDIDNTGTITVIATSLSDEQAVGTGVVGNTGIVTNNGTIAVTATGSAPGGTAIAAGVETGFVDGGVVNSGAIVVSSISDAGSDASGVNLYAATGSLLNSGSIKAFAVVASDPLEARAAAVSGYGGTLANSGAMVAGSTGEASGFDLFGDGSVTNTGEIRVAGADGTYGIYLRGGTWDVANPGLIQGYVAGDVLDESTWTITNGFRTLRVGQDALSVPAAATLTDDFQIIFNGDPDAVDYVIPIFVAEGSTLNLNSQNLIATPGSDVVLNKNYRVIENEGTVIGEFGGLIAGNAAVSTIWSGADNGENAAVLFGYEPEAPVTPEVAVTMADTATDQLRQFAMRNALRGTEVAPEGPTAIVRPWAGNLNRSKKDGVGYNAGMAGVLAGVEVPVNSDLVVGGHAVAGGARVDYTGTGYSSNSEDQAMFGLGAHGRYTPGDWYLDGMLTTYMVNHDYEGRTGFDLEFDEEDEYESYGIEGSLVGGHKFRHENITAMPFAGLGYSWLNTPGHETETATGTWQTKYGTLDEHNVSAIIGARVSAEYEALDGTLTPSLGLRYEHSLTDNDIRIHQSLQGASANVEGERADGSVILDAGLVYGRGPMALEVGGSIEKNDDYDAQSGFIGVRWTF
jgi:hypothetical protein